MSQEKINEIKRQIEKEQRAEAQAKAEIVRLQDELFKAEEQDRQRKLEWRAREWSKDLWTAMLSKCHTSTPGRLADAITESYDFVLKSGAKATLIITRPQNVEPGDHLKGDKIR